VIAFGPVPSRRLGQSLGVNHIPSKVCSYSCVYCQVGPTLRMRATRRTFLPSSQIAAAVMQRVDDCRASGEPIDYITFVPDGEPTLDADLGAHIRMLAPADVPIAVITNASLLWMPEVRADLALADLVSVKVDTTQPETWHRINRPHGELDLERILDGIRAFAREYPGELISETMLVGSINDDAESVGGVADFLADIAPACAYLGIPTRPPTGPDVVPPSNLGLVRAHEIMKARLKRVELLPMHENGTFATMEDPVAGLLGILAVHPMREAAVLKYLNDARADSRRLNELIGNGRVDRVDYLGETFIVRRVPRVRAGTSSGDRNAS
jgi:wyosine [tRNA(Phe)-imidazoG37] synthetase (radical SAM superfamily)